MMVKGAKAEVKNVEKGIQITITADDAAAVKEIQARGEKIGKGGGCPMMKEGKCPCAGGNDMGKQMGKCPMMQDAAAAPVTPATPAASAAPAAPAASKK
jgi:hypothetical protein